MKVFLFILCFFSINVYANEVKITVIPEEVVMGDSFNVEFKIVSKTATDPIINFNPSSGLEVLGRQETGVTTSTSYINGHLSVERSLTIVYEMIATRSGSKYLRDIQVEINGQTIRHKNVRIPVLKTAPKPKNILALAVVDKNEIFAGESIIVRYYLYNKVNVSSTDIKKFPKLDKFLKRYHQEKMRAQRVRYKGEIYTRRVLYTAQLFAEKPGEYTIDPITLRVQYYTRRSRRRNNLGLGLGLRKQMSATVRSNKISIKVKQLPLDNMPKHFTGLVGNHSFKLTQNKNKFLVNDPIELNFTVEGNGALELYQSPRFISDSSVEEFDSTSDLTVSDNFTASKVFNITYLGRSSVNIEGQKVPLSYFDPNKKEYITKYVDLKPIKIAGSSQYNPGKGSKVEQPQQPKPMEVPKIATPKDLEPVYSLVNSYVYSSKYINTFILALLLGLMSWGGIRQYKKLKLKEPDLVKSIKKEGADYGRLYSLISLLGHGTSLKEIINKSYLKDDTKEYLNKILDDCETNYAKKGEVKKYKIKSKYLNDILNTIDENEYIS